MKPSAYLFAVSSALLSTQTFAVDFRCYSDPRTDATTCLDVRQVREDDGIRFAQIFSGGPKTVRPTSSFLHANCKTGVVHLKDRDGVSFAGGTGNETAAVKELRSIICGAAIRKK